MVGIGERSYNLGRRGIARDGGTGEGLEPFVASFHPLPPAAGKSAPEQPVLDKKKKSLSCLAFYF